MQAEQQLRASLKEVDDAKAAWDEHAILRRLKPDPRPRAIRLAVVSSSPEKRDLIESYKLGVDSYIVKPVDFDEFGKSVRLLRQYWLRCDQTPKP